MKVAFICVIIVLAASLLYAEEDFEYDTKGKRDPFVPLVSEKGAYVSDAYGITSVKDIRLEGIVWDQAKGSVAIVNGEIIREGQEIGEVKVIKIEKDAVLFDANGETVKVELRID